MKPASCTFLDEGCESHPTLVSTDHCPADISLAAEDVVFLVDGVVIVVPLPSKLNLHSLCL